MVILTAALLLSSGAVTTLLTLVLIRGRLPRRRNFAGQNIPTATGLIFLPIILITLILVLAGVLPLGDGMLGFLVYSFVAGAVGFVDDVWGGAEARGFRGHLGALVHGRVTTGALKVFALGGGALVFGLSLFGVGLTALAAAFLLAGSVNLANLLDVRPGRALKFLGAPILVLLFVAPGTAAVAALPVVGGAVSLFYFDVRARIMLGDAGAAVYGAVLGYLVVACGPGVVWWVAGPSIIALTLVAEFSSISRIIEEVAVLRWFDLWGRGNRG